jgi:hypothetical protein
MVVQCPSQLVLCPAILPPQLLAELDRASACSRWLSSGTGVANCAASGATFGGTSVCTKHVLRLTRQHHVQFICILRSFICMLRPYTPCFSRKSVPLSSPQIANGSDADNISDTA